MTSDERKLIRDLSLCDFSIMAVCNSDGLHLIESDVSLELLRGPLGGQEGRAKGREGGYWLCIHVSVKNDTVCVRLARRLRSRSWRSMDTRCLMVTGLNATYCAP